jgi:hypothetical protein
LVGASGGVAGWRLVAEGGVALLVVGGDPAVDGFLRCGDRLERCRVVEELGASDTEGAMRLR